MLLLQKYHEELGKRGFVVLAISVAYFQKSAKRFFESGGFTFPGLYASDDTIFLYPILWTPTDVLINRQGIVRYVGVGRWARDEKRLRQEIEDLL